MNGHIRKARFNGNNNQSSLQATIKMQEKNYPPTRQSEHLTILLYWTRPHTPDTFNSQIKRNKEVATSLEVRWFPLVPAAHVSSAPTDSSRHVLDAAGSTSVLPSLVNQSAFAHTLASPGPKAHEAPKAKAKVSLNFSNESISSYGYIPFCEKRSISS